MRTRRYRRPNQSPSMLTGLKDLKNLGLDFAGPFRNEWSPIQSMSRAALSKSSKFCAEPGPQGGDIPDHKNLARRFWMGGRRGPGDSVISIFGVSTLGCQTTMWVPRMLGELGVECFGSTLFIQNLALGSTGVRSRLASSSLRGPDFANHQRFLYCQLDLNSFLL